MGSVRNAASKAVACGLLALIVSFQNWDTGSVESQPARPTQADSRRLVLTLTSGASARAVAAAHGLALQRSLPALRAAVVQGSAELAALRADPRVVAAGPDVMLSVHGDGCCGGAADAEVDPEPERALLAEAFGPLRALSQGARTLVAVLDTGVAQEHPLLQRAVVGGTSLLPGEPWSEDASGHGTAMASLVAAADPHGDGLEGMAPQAQLLSIRVADGQGRARASDVAAGLVQAADRGCDVALVSLGGRLPTLVIDDAIAYAEARGMLVVAAAGNRNTHQDLYPAADPRVISVASADTSGELAFATALAPTTDLTAPGSGALVCLPRGYGTVGGSSAAAARIAGVAALLRSLDPALSPAQLRALLRGARRPLPALADEPDLVRAFPAGPLDAQALVDAWARPPSLPQLLDARVLPAGARAGQLAWIGVQARNPGARRLPASRVEVLARGLRVATLEVPALAPGQVQTVSTHLVLPVPASGLTLRNASHEARPAATAAQAVRQDLAVVDVRARTTTAGEWVLQATVEGRGGLLGGALGGQLGELTLEPQPVPALRPGQQARVELRVGADVLAGLPDAVVTCQLRLVDHVDDDPSNDTAGLDLLPPRADAAELSTQYQQSGELTIIADAPWRLAPNRPHVPLLVYVAEKGDLERNTWVEVDRLTVLGQDHAARRANSPGQTVLYDDELGGPSVGAPGVVIMDELGQPQRRAGRPDLRLFRHERLDMPGRFAIVRLPRDAFGIAPTPAATIDRFLDVRLDWTNRRRFLRFFRRTRRGTLLKTLRVRFAADARPSLSNEGHYFDAHLHTAAEWYQDESFDVLAPKRNLGGPIPMLKESAYAIGLTDAIDDVKDRVITTDHNAFYNDGDTLRDRPPFGPTAVAHSGGLSEAERMTQIFGLGRGEEVAFSAPQNFLKMITLPFGAHMLTYRAEHIRGPWHGGSGVARALGDAYPNLELGDLVERLAKTNRAENRHAATFGAHPYSDGPGWRDRHFEAAFELDPAGRRDRVVRLEGDGFVTKGLQVWNSDASRRRLPHDKIDWWNMNPWVDPVFLRGNPDWDGQLQRGLGHWHLMLSRLLDYELAARPGVRFPRKLFVVAGNDAHGDFNYAESRTATLLNFKSTLKVHHRAFGRVLTYTFPETQESADPGERRVEAMLDGNSVLTDGPLVDVALDGEVRFDDASLQWTDQQPAFRDRQGRIGGGGAFDGRGTALVRRHSPHAMLGYRYDSTAEFGDVQTIEVYASRPGDPNPLGRRASGGERLLPRGELSAAGPGQDLAEPLDPAGEGLVSAPTLYQLGAYAGDPAALGVDETRCLTNPIWAIPFDPGVTVGRVETDASGRGRIPAGELTVILDFDMSMQPDDYGFEVKALDAQGVSGDKGAGPIAFLEPVGGNGWSTANGALDSRLTLTNREPIPLDLDRYPNASQVTLVVYSYRPLRDAHGNALHPVAFTVEEAGVGQGGGTGPSLTRPQSTAPGATPSAAPVATGGRRSGGGCALTPTRGSDASPAAWLALAALVLLVRRRRP
jgi:hypothetical protein